MKNIFDVDVDKGTYDGEIFCINEVAYETSEKIDDAYEDFDSAEEKTQQSWISVIVEILCMLIVIGSVDGFLDAGVTIKEAFSNAPVLFIITPAASIVWLIIFLQRRKERRNFETYLEKNQVLENMEDMMSEVAEELQIPKDSIKVDILADVYEMKRGKKKILTKPVTFSGQMDMYVKGEMLCFADAKQEFGIALKDIIHIEKVKKRLSIDEWHKEEEYKSKKYKKYKIEQNNYGLLIKGYYSIQINSIWGEFELRLPNYEEEAIMKIEEITGKSVLS